MNVEIPVMIIMYLKLLIIPYREIMILSSFFKVEISLDKGRKREWSDVEGAGSLSENCENPTLSCTAYP